MIRIGRKFLKPHLCPQCGAPVVLVRHPKANACKRCAAKAHRKSAGHKKQQQKYNSGAYRRARSKALANQPYCALCGGTEHLTCHHTVKVKSGEQQGKHLTVLCTSCHELWETKVNKIRALNN